MLLLQFQLQFLSFHDPAKRITGGYIFMSEATKEQIQQSMAAYGALLKHINR